MLGRNHFYGPSNWNLDFGIYKNFKVTEQFTVQFRGELYNIFNHHNYYVVTNATDFAATCADTSTAVDATHPCVPLGGFGNQLVAKKGGPFPGDNTQPTATGTDERRNVQFGLKLIF